MRDTCLIHAACQNIDVDPKAEVAARGQSLDLWPGEVLQGRWGQIWLSGLTRPMFRGQDQNSGLEAKRNYKLCAIGLLNLSCCSREVSVLSSKRIDLE